MSGKTKTLIITLGVLILLGGGYYGSTVWKKKKAEASSSSFESAPRLGNLERSEIVRIEIPDLVLEKNEEIWELVSLHGTSPPAGIELDQNHINRMLWFLSSVWAERIVDDDPADLSAYGLDESPVWAIVSDSAGTSVVYLLGDMLPSRTSYYFTEEGDPKVYSVSLHTAENVAFTLDSIRDKSLFPAFEFHAMSRLRLENAQTIIDLVIRPESAPPYLDVPFSTHIMTSPYRLTRSVDNQALYELLVPLNNLRIDEFIDDHPQSLSPYGLDRPVRFFLEIGDTSVDLLIGNRIDQAHYAKLAAEPGVFTVSGLDTIVNLNPFELVNKFAHIINIDLVDEFTISGGDMPISAVFQGTGDDAVFFLNGKEAETSSFKTFYQRVIGLRIDADITDMAAGPQGAGTGNITIEFRLNTPSRAQSSITLLPFNRDFYALRQEGTMEFLISRNQIRRIFETANAVVFEP